MELLPEDDFPATPATLQSLYDETLRCTSRHGRLTCEEEEQWLSLTLQGAAVRRLAPADAARLQVGRELSVDYWPSDVSSTYRWHAPAGASFLWTSLSLTPPPVAGTAWKHDRQVDRHDSLAENDGDQPIADRHLRRLSSSFMRMRFELDPPMSSGEAVALRGIVKVLADLSEPEIARIVVDDTE